MPIHPDDNFNDMLGKRILITQSSFAHIGGSEVQAFELAQYLREQGCEVSLYAWFTDYPMANLLHQAGLRVITRDCEESARLSLHDFDLIWVQHEALPISFFEQLMDTDSNMPKFIFAHMSPYKEVHLEQPYLFGLEDDYADAITFNAQGTLDAQRSYFDADDERLMLYPNPAPEIFARQPLQAKRAIERVLIVSNHPPEELKQAVPLFEAQGIQVDTLTEAIGDKPTVTSPELLSKYDCVISIGKTVQYCLAQGIPVFLYDRFGGPGYLNSSNFKVTSYFNFSGRMHDSAPSLPAAIAASKGIEAPDLVQQIINGYSDAQKFQSQYRQDFIEKYSIGFSFKAILNSIESRAIAKKTCSKEILKYAMHTSQMVSDYVHSVYVSAHVSKAFYAQPVEIYQRINEEAVPSSRYETGDITKSGNFAIDTKDCKSFRIDFGDMPCIIDNFNIDFGDVASIKITSSATMELDGIYVFLEPDPQFYIEVPRDIDAVTVSAEVYDIRGIPNTIVEKLRDIVNTNALKSTQLDHLLSHKSLRTILGMKNRISHITNKAGDSEQR